LEDYLNNFVEEVEGQGYGLALDPNGDLNLPYGYSLTDLTEWLNNYGVGTLSELIPDNYSAHNEQAYLNQKSFNDTISDNLRNGQNMPNNSSTFALNSSLSTGGINGQLASLRGAMNKPIGGLALNEGSSLSSGGVWAAYNGSHTSTDADSGVGSSQWSSSSDGFTAGYTAGGDNFRWGVAAGHQKSTLNFSDLDANGEVEGYNAGLYASWTHKKTYLTGVFAYGNYDNDAYDNLGTTSFKTKAYSGYLELGARLKDSKTSALTPYASVLYANIKNDDGTNVGSSRLHFNSASNNVTTTTLGLRYNHRMFDKSDTLKGGWNAGLAWLHQFGDTGFPVQVSYDNIGLGFPVQTTPLDGDSLQVQLGAYGRIHRNLIGFLGYRGTFGSNQKTNAVNAGVGLQF
jgi:uncharacterized protein with beta-barrel porin domain